jgi:hypothetical protein
LHRRQRVVHGLLLRMSLEPQIAAAGGIESRATHQASFSTIGRERNLSRRSSERSRTNTLTSAPGRELRPGKPGPGAARRAKPDSSLTSNVRFRTTPRQAKVPITQFRTKPATASCEGVARRAKPQAEGRSRTSGLTPGVGLIQSTHMNSAMVNVALSLSGAGPLTGGCLGSRSTDANRSPSKFPGGADR